MISKSIKQVKRKKGAKSKAIIILSLIILLFLIYFSIFIWPEAHIVLIPNSQSETTTFKFYVSISDEARNETLDYPTENIITGKWVEATFSQEEKFPVTKEGEVGQLAEGDVEFFNYTARAYSLATTSQLLSAGFYFRTLQPIVIPSAWVDDDGNIIPGRSLAKVTALKPGEQGNLTSGRLTIVDLPLNKRNLVFGEILHPFKGGQISREKVVTTDEVNTALSKLEPKVSQKIDELLNQQAGDFPLLGPLIFETDRLVRTNPLIGEPGEEFILELRLTKRLLTFSLAELRQLIISSLQDLKKPGMILLLKDNFLLEESVKEVKEIEPNLYQIILVVEIINSPSFSPEEIKSEIKGLPVTQARRLILSKPEIKDVKFFLKRNIWSRIPFQEQKLTFSLDLL